MLKIEEIIEKYDKPYYQNIRENLKAVPLLNFMETEDGAFFRFDDNGKPFCGIIAYSGSGAERLLNHINEKDSLVFIDLPKDERLQAETINKFNRDILEVLDCNTYCFLLKDIETIYDPHILEIDISEAEYIFNSYEEKETSSLEEIREDIKNRPAFGYYINGELVAWVLVHSDWQIGVLHVDKQHRKKGIAKKLMRAVTKAVIKEGRVPGCEIKRDNRASTAVVSSVGFTHVAQELWIMFA